MTVNKRARQSRKWRDTENKQAAQHYSKERFKLHLRSVMPCCTQKLSSKVGDRQGISVVRTNS